MHVFKVLSIGEICWESTALNDTRIVQSSIHPKQKAAPTMLHMRVTTLLVNFGKSSSFVTYVFDL